MTPDPVTLANTALPVALTGALAFALPALIAGSRTLSQRRLTIAILASAALILLVGAAIYAGLYQRITGGAATLFHLHPVQTTGFFLQRSVGFTLFWAPILGLVWLIRAQGVERRRGEDRALNAARNATPPESKGTS